MLEIFLHKMMSDRCIKISSVIFFVFVFTVISFPLFSFILKSRNEIQPEPEIEEDSLEKYILDDIQNAVGGSNESLSRLGLLNNEGFTFDDYVLKVPISEETLKLILHLNINDETIFKLLMRDLKQGGYNFLTIYYHLDVDYDFKIIRKLLFRMKFAGSEENNYNYILYFLLKTEVRSLKEYYQILYFAGSNNMENVLSYFVINEKTTVEHLVDGAPHATWYYTDTFMRLVNPFLRTYFVCHETLQLMNSLKNSGWENKNGKPISEHITKSESSFYRSWMKLICQ